MAEDREQERNELEEPRLSEEELERLSRAAQRLAESPADALRVGGGSSNFGRGDRSMFDPAAEEDPEHPDNLDGSIQP